MDNVTKKAYELFRQNFKSRAKRKLESSGRGVWTGKMIDTMDIQLEDGGDDIDVVIYAEDYLDFVDQGVNGVEQSRGSKFSFRDKKPPLKSISPWAKSKGLNAFAVQTSIWKKGIKGVKFFESTLEEEMEKMVDFLAEAQADELLNGFGD